MEKRAGQSQDNWAGLYGFCQKRSLYRLSHDLIVLKLRYVADGKTVNLINNCLSGCQQHVKLGHTFYSWQSNSRGVPGRLGRGRGGVQPKSFPKTTSEN